MQQITKSLPGGVTKAETDSLDCSHQTSDLELQKTFPLSAAQRGIWLASQAVEGNNAYNIPGIFVFADELNIEALRTAFQLLIKRHESLRTVFRKIDGEPKQIIKPAESFNFHLEVIDLEVEGDQSKLLQEQINRKNLKPFDLEKGPLIRAALYRLSDGNVVLSYVIHHIIFDGWSMKLLISELTRYYNALSTGQPLNLMPLEFQYKDYAIWQRQYRISESYKELKAYWLKQLNGDLPVLDLAADKIRPASKTFNGDTVTKELNGFVTKKLKRYVHDQQATLFMGLLTGINVLFYRYTGQNDIIIGTQIAGRQRTELENQIGNYLNTLPLRTQFNPEQSFQSLLATTKGVTLNAYEHQNFPFDDLVESLDLKFDNSRNPIFDVTLVLQIDELSKLNKHEDFGSHPVSDFMNEVYFSNSKTKFDLSIDVAEVGHSLKVSATYNTDIFEKATVKRLLNHLEQILIAVLNNPYEPINEIEFLSEDEKRLLIKTFNTDSNREVPEKTIPDIFREQVELNPDAIAVISNGRQLTYKELDELSDKLAYHLQEAFQIKHEQPIGIMLTRSELVVIAIMAILKSGGIYVPIDAEYPQTRKDYILKDANITTLITETIFLGEINPAAQQLFFIDRQLNNLPVNKPFPVKAESNSLAYIMYTSGSTGLPKGSLIEQSGIIRLALDTNYIEIGNSDVIVNLSSFAFDASVFDIFAALLNGARIVIPPKEHLLESKQLRLVFEENDANIFFVTTALFNILVEDSAVDLNNIKYLLFGGERVSLNHVKRFKDRYPNVRLVHMYGPTENTTFSTFYPVDKINSSDTTVPIGKPITNSTCYILNDVNGHFQLVPIGVTGEICVGGRGLSRGYLNQEQLTWEKFIKHPFLKDERIYRTGDLGKWLPSGDIEFIGRCDSQIKIRGHRIEPGEIEHILLSYPSIESAVITVKSDDNQNRFLVAYLIAEKDILLDQLKVYLKEHLPNYMIPTQFYRLEKFPLNANGKIDFLKISEDEGILLTTRKELQKPRNFLETELINIWEQILNVKNVGIDDDYFELGGNSLTAMMIIKQVSDVLHLNLTITEFFSLRIIRRIAESLKANDDSANLLNKDSAEHAYELSYNQLNYFVSWQFGTDLIVQPYFLQEIDIDALQKVFLKLIQRHEIFRTQILKNGSELNQRVLPLDDRNFRLEINLVGDDFDINPTIQSEERRKIDPLSYPLISAKVYLQDNHGGYVVLTMHHMIVDGFSMGILQNEFNLLYRSELRGEMSTLRKPLNQYRDFVVWQRQFVQSEQGWEHSRYWNKKLSANINGCSFLVDGAVLTTDTMIAQDLFIEGENLMALNSFMSPQGITIPIVLIATLNLLAYHICKQQCIIIQTTLTGRISTYSNLDTEGIIGLFANPIFLKNDVEEAQLVSDFIKDVAQNFLSDLEHGSYPAMKLLEELPSINPDALINNRIAFNYHNYDYMRCEMISIPSPEQCHGNYEVPNLKGAMGVVAEEYKNAIKLQILINKEILSKVGLIDVQSLYKKLLFNLLRNSAFSIHDCLSQI